MKNDLRHHGFCGCVWDFKLSVLYDMSMILHASNEL